MHTNKSFDRNDNIFVTNTNYISCTVRCLNTLNQTEQSASSYIINAKIAITKDILFPEASKYIKYL